MTSELTVFINVREALPVRAIPYVAGCDFYSPDEVANHLARTVDTCAPKLPNTTAFRLSGTTLIKVLPKEWHRVVAKLEALAAREQRLMKETSDAEGYEQWLIKATQLLPAAVFVWRDEFESDFQIACEKIGRPECEGNNELNFSPMLSAEERKMILEDTCMMAGTNDVIHLDDFICLTGRGLGSDGLYRIEESGGTADVGDIPTSGSPLTSEEQQILLKHKRKSKLDFPCNAQQLIEWVDGTCGEFTLPVNFVRQIKEETKAKINNVVFVFDIEIDANHWWGLKAVTASEAAMLLFRVNPHAGYNDLPHTKTDETLPGDYKCLLRAFEDENKADSRARTLRQWHEMVHAKALKHHSWICRYSAAINSGGLSVNVSDLMMPEPSREATQD